MNDFNPKYFKEILSFIDQRLHSKDEYETIYNIKHCLNDKFDYSTINEYINIFNELNLIKLDKEEDSTRIFYSDKKLFYQLLKLSDDKLTTRVKTIL